MLRRGGRQRRARRVHILDPEQSVAKALINIYSYTCRTSLKNCVHILAPEQSVAKALVNIYIYIYIYIAILVVTGILIHITSRPEA